jgi:type IV pilus assembly protein PilW
MMNLTRKLPLRISRNQGFSLIELMISITIALILTAGIGYVIMSTSNTRKELDRMNRQIENGRYAMQVLTDDLSHAGHFGRLYEFPATPGTLPNPCDMTASTLRSAVALPVQGYDEAKPTATECNTVITDYKTGTDVLVVRRASSVETDIDDIDDSENAKRVFIQSAALSYKVDTGENTGTFTLKKKNHTDLIEPRAYVVHIYWINTSNQLMMRELDATSSATTFTSVPIADGIEDLQLDYGIDSTGPDLDDEHAGADPDGNPDSYSVCAACTTANWENVTTIRINLLARNPEKSAGYSDSAKEYSMGLKGMVGPFSDGYRRHAYQGLARLNNIGGRREL